MTERSTPSLTYGLRELVWSIESEVALITSVSRRIDEHVTAVNAARAEAAERLVRLDALVAAADDPALEAFLRERSVAPLPAADEHFPDRLYG